MKRLGLCLAIGSIFLAAVPVQEIKAEDGDDRTEVSLTPSERAYVLGQMRFFVESIQSITLGLADGDLALASEAAAARGAKRNANDPTFPPTLGAKLPQTWKQFGGNMRKGFDVLAQGIADKEETSRSLKQLSEVTTNCVACHASYRIVDAKF